ncbi:hypothetical protein ACQFN5_26800 [Klebsiella sp. WOUb02]
MGINELRFDWAFLQWVVMAVVGIYTWLIGRQSASQKESAGVAHPDNHR